MMEVYRRLNASRSLSPASAESGLRCGSVLSISHLSWAKTNKPVGRQSSHDYSRNVLGENVFKIKETKKKERESSKPYCETQVSGL